MVAPREYMDESVRMQRRACCKEVVTPSTKLDG
jgi:hypothetical protein